MTKYILIFGNPVEGFTFRGPFDTQEEAVDYADPIMEEWWTAELTLPEETKTQRTLRLLGE